MKINHLKLHYRGSIFWLIVWGILFFPIALVLLFTSSSFELNDSTYNFQYEGSRFWLCFWVLAFFPIAFVLLFVNGYTISVDRKDDFYVK